MGAGAIGIGFNLGFLVGRVVSALAVGIIAKSLLFWFNDHAKSGSCLIAVCSAI